MKGWRRLIFLGALLITCGALVYFSRLKGEEFVALWQYLGVAYLGSDGVEKTAKAWTGRPPAVVRAVLQPLAAEDQTRSGKGVVE